MVAKRLLQIPNVGHDTVTELNAIPPPNSCIGFVVAPARPMRADSKSVAPIVTCSCSQSLYKERDLAFVFHLENSTDVEMLNDSCQAVEIMLALAEELDILSDNDDVVGRSRGHR